MDHINLGGCSFHGRFQMSREFLESLRDSEIARPLLKRLQEEGVTRNPDEYFFPMSMNPDYWGNHIIGSSGGYFGEWRFDVGKALDDDTFSSRLTNAVIPGWSPFGDKAIYMYLNGRVSRTGSNGIQVDGGMTFEGVSDVPLVFRLAKKKHRSNLEIGHRTNVARADHLSTYADATEQ